MLYVFYIMTIYQCYYVTSVVLHWSQRIRTIHSCFANFTTVHQININSRL